MIKEKTIYHSTATGRDYKSLVEALKAEKSENIEKIKNLVSEFHEIYGEYKSELDNINSLFVKMDAVVRQKMIKLHDKFDPKLNSITEQLHSMGVDVSEIVNNDSYDGHKESDHINPESSPKVRSVKVRVVKRKLS